MDWKWGRRMTREETIAYFKDMNECTYGDVEPIQMAIKSLEQEPKINDMTSSHSEKEIYKGCISLMRELTDSFYEWLDFIGVDITKLDEEEQFERSFYPTHIVEKLFLRYTTHSGGTSQRMKCEELGVDTDDIVKFDFFEE